MSRRRCESESSPKRLEQTASQIARMVIRRERHIVIDHLRPHHVARRACPDHPLGGSSADSPSGPICSPNGVDGARFLSNNESMSGDRVDEVISTGPHRAPGRPVMFWLLATALCWVTIRGTFVIAGKISWGSAILSAALSALPDALLVPPALWMTRRNLWGRVSTTRFVLAHLAGAVVFWALSTGA